MNKELNSFQAPTSVVEPVDQTYDLELASRGHRFGTLVVDYFGYIVLSFLVLMVVAVLLGQESVKALSHDVSGLVFGWAIIFTYYMFFECIWGRTAGKWLFGTVVVNDGGGKPSMAQIAGRTASRFIPFDGLSFFAAKGWHDGISNTLVVRAKRLP
jgi:uncharacterized RDD family membrane protein YckC